MAGIDSALIKASERLEGGGVEEAVGVLAKGEALGARKAEVFGGGEFRGGEIFAPAVVVVVVAVAVVVVVVGVAVVAVELGVEGAAGRGRTCGR